MLERGRKRRAGSLGVGRRQAPSLRLRTGVVAAVLASTLGLAAAQLPPLVDVPQPVVTGIESSVRTQLEEARQRLDRLRGGPGVDARELGLRYGELGQIYLVYDLVDAAAAALENASRLLPDDGRWPYLLGTIHEHDRRLEEAARWYQAARDADATYLPTLLRLGDVRLLQNDLAAARSLYGEALALAPDDAYTHAALGRLAAREQKHQDAARSFERALELDPDATSLHYPASQAYRALGDEERMRRHLERRGNGRVRFADPVAEEVQRQVRGAGAELLLARMALREGAVDTALERVRRAIELDPDNASAHNNLAVVLEAKGQIDEAVAAYREAARLDPSSVGRRFTLARLLGRLGRDEEAAAELRSVLALAPDFGEGRIELARVLTRQGRPEEAELEYREALLADPRATPARWELVAVLERLGKKDEARRELDTLLAAAPDFAPAQFKLGGVLAEAGDTAGAIERFRRAAELDPDMAEAHQNLAILYGRGGDFAAAARHQQRAVDLGPESPEARLTLATALILGNQLQDARRALEEAAARHPSDPRIADTLARVLATAPDAAVRDGRRAADIASQLLQDAPSPQHAETLAMALAEVGRFDDAIKLQEQVVERLEQGGAAGDLVAEAKSRLDRYRQGVPARAPWR
jgi:tetratricopeptide (TPR) repeat protein